MTYDTKGVYRCYEIKISKADFHSKAHNTFVGHYNYYVMPHELYEQVKDEIPKHIGVYISGRCIKNAKKQQLAVAEQTLKDSLLRSLYREAEKVIKSENPNIIDSLKRQLKEQKARADRYYRDYWDLMRYVEKKFGTRWPKGR